MRPVGLSTAADSSPGVLEQDGLALVEYALMLQSTGCVLDLRGRHRQLEVEDSRRQLQYLSQWLGASGPECDWSE